jgi:hypothetical protein
MLCFSHEVIAIDKNLLIEKSNIFDKYTFHEREEIDLLLV